MSDERSNYTTTAVRMLTECREYIDTNFNKNLSSEKCTKDKDAFHRQHKFPENDRK